MSDLLESLRTRGPVPVMCGDIAAAQHPYRGQIAQPQFYRAQHGRRRQFLSQADADAYDDGWGMFPCECPDEFGTPRSQGYFDHEAQYMDRSGA